MELLVSLLPSKILILQMCTILSGLLTAGDGTLGFMNAGQVLSQFSYTVSPDTCLLND